MLESHDDCQQQAVYGWSTMRFASCSPRRSNYWRSGGFGRQAIRARCPGL